MPTSKESLQARNLKIFRKDLELSQKDLVADYKLCSQSTLCPFESGEVLIPDLLVKYLHNKYDMSYTWFYNNADPKTTKEERNLLFDLKSVHQENERITMRVQSLENWSTSY